MVVALAVALALMVVGTVLLVRGSDWLIDGIGDWARLLGVSAVVLGAVLAGLEPEEMLTAAIASGRGASDLAVGDVIGLVEVMKQFSEVTADVAGRLRGFAVENGEPVDPGQALAVIETA